ncbi:MAG: TetR/AcrR family transcriptional regulator [Actinomycetia bacterium]|nr:TetR/AcrR family transcriptional regulator [Actinomycetes bacterium]
MPTSAPRTARQRARTEITAEILATARRQVAEVGPGQLSLRAVARELGMASSALYRYFPDRDALLTQLIIVAYDELGDACDAGLEAARSDPLCQWRALANSARAWARSNPQMYALIYGTPVPGYAAPHDTVDPATRVFRQLGTICVALDQAGVPVPDQVAIPKHLAEQISRLLDSEEVELNHQRFMAATSAWALLFGMVSFEVFGRYTNMFDDVDALFTHQVDRVAISMGMTP